MPNLSLATMQTILPIVSIIVGLLTIVTTIVVVTRALTKIGSDATLSLTKLGNDATLHVTKLSGSLDRLSDAVESGFANVNKAIERIDQTASATDARVEDVKKDVHSLDVRLARVEVHNELTPL